MYSCSESKISNFCAAPRQRAQAKLDNSPAITCIFRLELEYFGLTSTRPELIRGTLNDKKTTAFL